MQDVALGTGVLVYSFVSGTTCDYLDYVKPRLAPRRLRDKDRHVNTGLSCENPLRQVDNTPGRDAVAQTLLSPPLPSISDSDVRVSQAARAEDDIWNELQALLPAVEPKERRCPCCAARLRPVVSAGRS